MNKLQFLFFRAKNDLKSIFNNNFLKTNFDLSMQYEIEYEVDKPKHGYLKQSNSKAIVTTETVNTTSSKKGNYKN